MSRDDHISNTELSFNFTSEDESLETIGVSSDNDSLVGKRKKRLRV